MKTPTQINIKQYAHHARLIAAAPALLDALVKCENVIGFARLQSKLSDSPMVNNALKAARAAIDATRGEVV